MDPKDIKKEAVQDGNPENNPSSKKTEKEEAPKSSTNKSGKNGG